MRDDDELTLYLTNTFRKFEREIQMGSTLHKVLILSADDAGALAKLTMDMVNEE